MLKLVLNLSTLCVHVFHGPRTNLPLYNQDVWSTKLGVLIAILCTMTKRTEPWQQGLKTDRRAVRVYDSNSKIAQHANQFGHSMDYDQATIVDKARDNHKRRHAKIAHNSRHSTLPIPTIVRFSLVCF